MRRYQGEALPERPLIAVVANDAIGNYVVTTPLLQALKAKFEGCQIHYYSGTRVDELVSADPNIDWSFPLLGSEPYVSVAESQLKRVNAEGDLRPYDLVVNVEWSAWPKAFTALIAEGSPVCGPCLAPTGRGDWAFPDDQRGDLWRDQEWIAEDLASKYPFLESGFIAEIFCRLAYLGGSIPRYSAPRAEPPVKTPDVLIATAASLPEKLWPSEKWMELVRVLDGRGLSVGLIGAKPTVQKQFWEGGSGEEELVSGGLVRDLRGVLTLPEVVGALAAARLVVTLDNGILHLAAASDVPIVGLYRYGIHRLWAPPYENVRVVTASEGRSVSEITVEEVIDAI